MRRPRDSHLYLSLAPYVLYGGKYIDPVSLETFCTGVLARDSHHDLSRAHHVVYGVIYIWPRSPIEDA